MLNTHTQIIERLGATDQLYLTENSPELALERGDLRLQLVTLSKNRQERVYFLHEAIAILESARIEFEEMPMRDYIQLSLQLGKAYMMYFELTQEHKFAIITQQILKPLAHLQDANVYFFLAYASSVKNEVALTKHWLKKYAKTEYVDVQLLIEHSGFAGLRQESWFKDLVKAQLH
ncbi:hypothetical protein [Acinetobacter sp. MD2(2019)]|uniref:hypothetical protein n=1 Tax=Acinetobacter sp. MD2(2019) TaxID=2605273 RepID=UPI002D1F46DC|nr:hypothetical protein [Acinetobacter sp. MD2(2019)]MEB3752984.1 hypothetical protein [Acinetobacter sp. MD2(2019)]